MIFKFFSFSIFFCFGYAALSGETAECINAVLEGVGNAVTLSLTLAGMICFWNGTVSVIKDSKILPFISKLLSPFTKFIFPSAANDTVLCEKLSLFTCANALGLGNAATPIALGIMKGLDDGGERVNDDMVMLCLTSTAPISLLPTTVMSILQKNGFTRPSALLPYVWICSFLSFLIAVFTGKLYCALRKKG